MSRRRPPLAPLLALASLLRGAAGRQLDFGHVKYSNLGGAGPDTDALHGIRYIDVAQVDGSRIDMLVVVEGPEEAYTPHDVTQNGCRAGHGVVNMKGGTNAVLTFKLFRPDTAELVEVDDFFLTVLGICGRMGRQGGQITASDFEESCVPSEHRLTQELSGEGYLTVASSGAGAEGTAEDAKEWGVASSGEGATADEDASPECGASLRFANTSTFSVRFEVAGPAAHVGKNFLLSGKPLPQCFGQQRAATSTLTSTAPDTARSANKSTLTSTTAANPPSVPEEEEDGRVHRRRATTKAQTTVAATTDTMTVTLTTLTQTASATSTTQTPSTTITSTTTEPYDCGGTEPWGWSAAQQSWCCEHHGVGCPVEKVSDWTDQAVATCTGSEKQWIICSGMPECDVCEPRDCTFTSWSDWSVLHGCVGLCSRRRSVNQTSNACGSPCTGPRVETAAMKECMPEECTQDSKDCHWGAWSAWSDCQGYGDDVQQSFRSRDIAQLPAGSGKQCVGPWNETRPCQKQQQVDCVLSDWGDWTGCSATCGGGWKVQMRRIIEHAKGGGKACSGAVRRGSTCNVKACGPQEACEFDEWQSWVGCSPSSPRQKRRSRAILSSPPDGLNCSQTVQEVASCDASGAKPRPCQLTPWSDWSSCSATCEGQRFRRREIAEGEPSDCFLETADTVEETVPCGASSCGAGVDCEFGEWTEWDNCSQACGVGVASRSRAVKSPGREGGLSCSGGLEEVKACMATECLAVDCQWAQWDDWAACTRTCGGGNMRRTRTVLTTQENGGAPCAPEDKAEVAPCATQSCEVCIDGAWSSWEDWSDCSATCGGGLRARHREVAQRPNSCGRPAVGLEDEYDVCNDSPCEGRRDCELSEWTEWSSCSSDCFGVREKSRHVVQYASGGGEACQNESLKVVSPCRPGPDEDAPAECGEQPPKPCRMAAWEDWGSCSASCDGGQKKRQRTVESPSQNGGAPCAGSTSEEAPCGTEPCDAKSGNDCRWGHWSEWSDCAQCGGQRNRHRVIARPARAGGTPCDAGHGQEVEPCESPCEQSYYCAWSDWSGMGGCSAECGHASQMRQRQLVFTKEEPSHGSILFEGSYDLSCAGSQINVSMCPYVDCEPTCTPQDCLFGAWSEWTEPTCLQLCERHRVIEKMDSCGGKSCNGSILETKNCGKPCVVTKNCEMSDWSAWEPPECSKSGQQRFRTREILQAPTELGKPCTGSINETVSCIVPPPASVDCALSPWVPWSECTRTCDGGLRRRARSIENASESGGVPCRGPLEQLEPCATEPCIHSARPCEMGAWSEWSRCDGNQMQSRQRRVEQEADDSGTQCAGPTKETQPCSAVVDCVVSDWTAWDECDATCGGGQQARERAVVQAQSHGGARCAAHLAEMRGCNSDPCGGSAGVGAWSEWGVCDADCGAGSMERHRTVKGTGFSGESAQALACLGAASNSSDCARPVDCQWADWDDWTECSLSCDGGQRERARDIVRPPQLGGQLCDARSKEEVEPCNLERCDTGECVDGKWADWQEWTPCSATCDGGVSFRSRLVAREASHCGQPATGSSIEHKACNAGVECIPSQDCQFADWSEWTNCTAACAGVKRRSRGFAQLGRGDGNSCAGALQQTSPCARPGADCDKEQAVDCQVGDWQSWDACDATCGAGQKVRSRDILQEASGGGMGCQDNMIETAHCQSAPCASACNATDCVWGDWDDWSACDKCGGQKRRHRAIERHPACGGTPCDPGATEEIEECPRQCHGATFCAWSDWSNFTECSATCGNAVKSRERRLHRREGGPAPEDAEAHRRRRTPPTPTAELELQAKYDELHRRAEALAESRRRQLAVAWGAGMLGLVALLVAGAALRTRTRAGEGHQGRPIGRALLSERFDGYTAAPQMSPPSSPMSPSSRLPGRRRGQ